MSELPSKLAEIVDDFRMCEGQEKLELLLEYAGKLRPLPARLTEDRSSLSEVNECMTPVFIHAERNGDGGFTFHLDAPQESPTVRGFAAVLQTGLDGASAEEIAAVPTELYLNMGLQSALSGQRLNGMGAILAHMKKLVREAG